MLEELGLTQAPGGTPSDARGSGGGGGAGAVGGNAVTGAFPGSGRGGAGGAGLDISSDYGNIGSTCSVFAGGGGGGARIPGASFGARWFVVVEQMVHLQIHLVVLLEFWYN